ncbi:hypothetical protein P4S72_27485 [Vibrio sp. PP-XX7]
MSTAFDLSAQLTDPTLFTSQAYLCGHWCDAEDGKTIEVVNPATGDVIATVPDISPPNRSRTPLNLPSKHGPRGVKPPLRNGQNG